MQKVVYVVGPTAVGKTAISFELAEKFQGELINADSVQVYKGLDIVSGKDIPKNTNFHSLPQLSDNGFYSGFYNHNNVPIFLLDVVEPNVSFSVSQFQLLANKAIGYILEKGELPIVVGGTGLYVKSLTSGIGTSDIEPNPVLRAELGQLSLAALQNKLQKLDKRKFSSMNISDLNNKRRLIRAIEVTGSKGQKPAINKKGEYESFVIGLYCEKETLKGRIDRRVEERLQNGAIDEVETLFKDYENLCQQVKDANGYKQLFSYLKKEISYDEMIYRWKISEYHHAKNQMTWFRKYGGVKWFDITRNGFEKEIEISLKKFLKQLL